MEFVTESVSVNKPHYINPLKVCILWSDKAPVAQGANNINTVVMISNLKAPIGLSIWDV